MPLKYTVETILIVLLAIVTIATGIFVSVLPNIPTGLLPWLVVFILTTVYVLAFYPLFFQQRADMKLRFLHWLPALILLGWLAIQLIKSVFPSLSILDSIYTFAGSFLAVASAFYMMLKYCIGVLRHSGTRMALLAILFVPYTIFAALQARNVHVGERVKNLVATVQKPFVSEEYEGEGVEVAGAEVDTVEQDGNQDSNAANADSANAPHDSKEGEDEDSIKSTEEGEDGAEPSKETGDEEGTDTRTAFTEPDKVTNDAQEYSFSNPFKLPSIGERFASFGFPFGFFGGAEERSESDEEATVLANGQDASGAATSVSSEDGDEGRGSSLSEAPIKEITNEGDSNTEVAYDNRVPEAPSLGATGDATDVAKNGDTVHADQKDGDTEKLADASEGKDDQSAATVAGDSDSSRSDALAIGDGTQKDIQGSTMSAQQKPVLSGHSSSLPSHLPQSGLGGIEFLVLLCGAGYCSVLHRRFLKQGA